MSTTFNPYRYAPLKVGAFWVVTNMFVQRHNQFIRPGWEALYWDKSRSVWLLPDKVLTQARRALLEKEAQP